MKKILFVCLGNICRSAAAESVMKQLVDDAGLSDSFVIDSAGILSIHKGETADYRMKEHATRRGYTLTSLSRPVEYADFEIFDLIIGMDNTNVDDLCDRAPTLEAKRKISKMTDFCQVCDEDYIPDPYYGGDAGFEFVLDILEDACRGLLLKIQTGKI